jgi:hypothetical protein
MLLDRYTNIVGMSLKINQTLHGQKLPLKYLINVTGERFQAWDYLECLNYSA